MAKETENQKSKRKRNDNKAPDAKKTKVDQGTNQPKAKAKAGSDKSGNGPKASRTPKSKGSPAQDYNNPGDLKEGIITLNTHVVQDVIILFCKFTDMVFFKCILIQCIIDELLLPV